MEEVTVEITGMSCGHCVGAVQRALTSVPGVATSQVAVGSALLEIDSQAGSPEAISAAALRAIRGAGYEAAIATPGKHSTFSKASGGGCCGTRSR